MTKRRIGLVVGAALVLPVLALGAPVAAKPKPKAAPQIIVTASPNPVIETGASDVNVIVQVEANPSFANDSVTLSSTQLTSRCPGGVFYATFNSAFIANAITVTLDNDGNATVPVVGLECAPGTTLIDASLDAPPFATATTKLVVSPPQVTPPGVHAFPNAEVEVGDNPAAVSPNNAASEADFVFYVETNPVYAEQSASIASDQLTIRCGGGYFWDDEAASVLKSGGATTGVVASQAIDNDGNAVFVFYGASCAAGKSTVIAEIGGGGPTYSTQVAVLPPAVTV